MKAFWQKNEKWLIPLLLFLFALALRLFYLNLGLFHHDVAQTAVIIENAVFHEGNLLNQDLFSLRLTYLLFNFVLFWILSFFGITSSVILLHISSAVFGALSCMLLYFFAEKITCKKSVAIISALLFSVTPIFLSVGTYGKEHGIQVFLFLTSCFLILKSNEKRKNIFFVLTGIIISLFLLSKEDSFLFFPLFVYLFYFYKKEKKEMSNWISLCVPILFLFGWYFLFFLSERIKIILFSQDLSAGHWLGFFSSPLVGMLHDISFSLTWLGVLLFFIGAYMLFIQDKKCFSFCIIWIAYLFYYGNNTIYASRWLSIFLPAFLLLIAYGIVSLSSLKKQKGIIPLVTVILLLWMLLSIHPLLSTRSHENYLVSYITEIDKYSPSESHVFLPGDACIFFTYYTTGKTCSPNKPLKDMLEMLDRKNKEGIPTFLAPSITRKEHGDDPYLKKLATDYKSEKLFTKTYEDYHKASIQVRKIDLPFFSVTRKE